jgi:hypothetical protein
MSELQLFALGEGLRRVAPEHQRLADSLSFGQRMLDVAPSAPDYDNRLRVALRAELGLAPEEIAAERAAAEGRQLAADAMARRNPARQWSAADVDAAGLTEVTGAYHRGQLTELMGGPPPRRPERREAAGPVAWMTAGQAARIRKMPPWAAQRARREWLAGHGGGVA